MVLTLLSVRGEHTVLASSNTSFVIGSTTYTTNGITKSMDVAPYISNGRTYLPVRYVADTLGVPSKKVLWNGQSQTVTLIKDDIVVQLRVGSNTMSVNGALINMDVAPEIINGRICLPIAFLCQAFNGTAGWDAAANTVYINVLGIGEAFQTINPSNTNIQKQNQYTDTANQFIGNSPGNLINLGIVCQNGDWIYFANPGDSNRLYRVSTNGFGKQKMADEDPITCINAGSEWLYYIEGDVDCGGYLMRMRTDGSDKQKLSDELYTWLCFYKDKLYFNSTQDGLGCMNPDGSQVIFLDPSTSHLSTSAAVIMDDWIYYSRNKNSSNGWYNELYKVRIDGNYITKITKLSGEIHIINFVIVGDWIYFVNYEDKILYRIQIDGTNLNQVNNQIEWGSLNANGSWLYSWNYDKNTIYRMDVNGTQIENILQDSASNLNIVNDWIYFENSTKWQSNSEKYHDAIIHLYRAHLDGSGLELVGEGPAIRYF